MFVLRLVIDSSNGSMRKAVALFTLPPKFWTLIKPVVAPAGTFATITLSFTFVAVCAAVPLNKTFFTNDRFVPVIVTGVPTTPACGEKLLMIGAPKNVWALAAVPPGVVTEIPPVTSPGGTTAVIVVLFTTVKLVALVTLNTTAEALVKFLPVIVTVVPVARSWGKNH